MLKPNHKKYKITMFKRILLIKSKEIAKVLTEMVVINLMRILMFQIMRKKMKLIQ